MSDLATAEQPLKRHEVRLLGKAVRRGWNIPDDLRDRIIDMASGMVDDTALPALRRLAAAKLVIQADAVNVRREAIESQEDRADTAASAAALKAALLANPQLRELLSQLNLPLPDPTQAPLPPDASSAP